MAAQKMLRTYVVKWVCSEKKIGFDYYFGVNKRPHQTKNHLFGLYYLCRKIWATLVLIVL